MGKRAVNVSYDAEGDHLEVIFDQRDGYFRATGDDRVMEKVDAQGAVLGFSILGVSSLQRDRLLQVMLSG